MQKILSSDFSLSYLYKPTNVTEAVSTSVTRIIRDLTCSDISSYINPSGIQNLEYVDEEGYGKGRHLLSYYLKEKFRGDADKIKQATKPSLRYATIGIEYRCIKGGCSVDVMGRQRTSDLFYPPTYSLVSYNHKGNYYTTDEDLIGTFIFCHLSNFSYFDFNHTNPPVVYFEIPLATNNPFTHLPIYNFDSLKYSLEKQVEDEIKEWCEETFECLVEIQIIKRPSKVMEIGMTHSYGGDPFKYRKYKTERVLCVALKNLNINNLKQKQNPLPIITSLIRCWNDFLLFIQETQKKLISDFVEKVLDKKEKGGMSRPFVDFDLELGVIQNKYNSEVSSTIFKLMEAEFEKRGRNVSVGYMKCRCKYTREIIGYNQNYLDIVFQKK
jgi:hypothetical protein